MVDKGVEVPTKYRSFSIVDKIVIDKYGGETQVLDTEDETAVSYTHLDVYKRQGGSYGILQ